MACDRGARSQAMVLEARDGDGYLVAVSCYLIMT